jgi:hypothetical protein
MGTGNTAWEDRDITQAVHWQVFVMQRFSKFSVRRHRSAAQAAARWCLLGSWLVAALAFPLRIPELQC